MATRGRQNLGNAFFFLFLRFFALEAAAGSAATAALAAAEAVPSRGLAERTCGGERCSSVSEFGVRVGLKGVTGRGRESLSLGVCVCLRLSERVSECL